MMESSLAKLIRLRNVPVLLPDVKLTGDRHVRTPEGADKYDLPINALIVPDVNAPSVPTGGSGAGRAPQGGSGRSPAPVRAPGAGQAPQGHTTGEKLAAQKQGHLKTLTDEQNAKQISFVEETLKRVFNSMRTSKTHRNEKGAWERDRARKHKEIVDSLYDSARDVPNDRQALFSGGLGGAGKGTVLADHADVPEGLYLTIDSDAIKEEMGRRGMIPDVPGLTPAESVALIHEESSHISDLLTRRAMLDGKNIIRDITMSGAGDGAQDAERRINELKAEGYDVDAIFVDISPEDAVRRAKIRHKVGHEKFLNGEGWGGRFVPPAVIRENAPKGDKYSSSNRETFEDLRARGLFRDWMLWDNSVDGRDPKKIDSSDGLKDGIRARLESGRSGTAKEQVAAGKIEEGGI